MARTFGFILMTALFIGCGGGRMMVTANRLEHPVSTTSGVYDDKLELINEGSYTTESFSFTIRRWHILWTALPLSGNPDISDTLNGIIREKKGDGIVNLTVKTDAMNPLNWMGSILPIIPTMVAATIEGDVIHLLR